MSHVFSRRHLQSDRFWAKGLWTLREKICVSFMCTCRSHAVFPPGLCMFTCPRAYSLCSFSWQRTAYAEEAACRYIKQPNTHTSCMTLLISSLLVISFLTPFCVETLTFLSGTFFFFDTEMSYRLIPCEVSQWRLLCVNTWRGQTRVQHDFSTWNYVMNTYTMSLSFSTFLGFPQLLQWRNDEFICRG